MKIKKGNLNFDQTGRAYPDNPHIKENWDCIWEYEGNYYKLVGDINNKEWEEITQLDIILTSHMVPEEYLGRKEDPKNEVFGYKTSIVHTNMLDVDLALLKSKETIEEAADKWVFETNGHKWSNNDDTAGDNYGSFKAGAKWMEEQMESLKDFETWKEWKK
jgi:hypothetical protein